MNRKISRLILVMVLLGIGVVTLGAYTRLTNAGLGCPDWPGCYGHMVLPKAKQSLVSAQEAYPNIPIEQVKAWTEMVHRYFAGTLALLVLGLFLFAVTKRIRKQSFPLSIPVSVAGLIIFQALLGMWTVTLKLLPVVVMGHLLGGMAIVSLLWWLYLDVKSTGIKRYKSSSLPLPTVKRLLLIGLVLLVAQIALGGWVSANYAGVSCIGFPFCSGEVGPYLKFKDAFNLASPIGQNYQGGLLDSHARVTIQFVHRLGALIVFCYWLLTSLYILVKGDVRLKRTAVVILCLLMLQFSLGLANVVYLLPLPVAVAHNGVALLLLLAVITLIKRSGHQTRHLAVV